MLPIANIVKTIRSAVHDTDGITYTDDEIVGVINAGLRFVRRTVAEIQPELISETIEGELQADEQTVTLDCRVLKIVDVTAGDTVTTVTIVPTSPYIYHNYEYIYGCELDIYSPPLTIRSYGNQEPLSAINLRHVNRRTERGKPRAYYRIGPRTIYFTPIPQTWTAYTIRYIRDLEPLTLADDSPLLTDLDDFLVEYAVIRLSIGNEYDVSQEQVIMSNIVAQMQRLLCPPPSGIRVVGYWNDLWMRPYRRGDY